MPEQPIQKKGSQRRNRNATVKAVYLLLNKPMRVERLAEAVDLPLRQTYRIITHLKATGWLQCDRSYYWLNITP